MKLRIHDIRGNDGASRITHALLKLDLGARISISPETQLVRIAGRLTVGDATAAIERCGFKVVSVLDQTVVDAGFRTKHSEVLAF